MKDTMSGQDWTLLVTLSLLWGVTFALGEVALVGYGPLWFVAWRVGFGALFLLLFLVIGRVSLPWAAWPAFFGMAVLNNVIPFSLIIWAQTEITSGLASILNATTPFFAVAVGALVIGRASVSVNRLVGLCVGLVGTILLLGPDLLGFDRSLTHQAAMLAAAFSYALAGYFGRRYLGSFTPLQAATGMVTASAVIALPTAWLLEGPPMLALNPAFWSVLVSGFFCTALAYLVYFRLLKSAGANNLLLTTMVIPPAALAIGWLVLAETFYWRELMGLCVILVGLAIVDGRILALLGVKGRRVS